VNGSCKDVKRCTVGVESCVFHVLEAIEGDILEVVEGLFHPLLLSLPLGLVCVPAIYQGVGPRKVPANTCGYCTNFSVYVLGETR